MSEKNHVGQTARDAFTVTDYPYIASGGKHNDRLAIDKHLRAFLDARDQDRRRLLEQQYVIFERMRPSAEQRDLKRKLSVAVLDKLGLREDYDRLRALVKDHQRTVARTLLGAHEVPIERPRFPVATADTTDFVLAGNLPPPADIGEMWWAQTDWSYPLGSGAVWWDDRDGVHVAARFDSTSDDLQKQWIDVTAKFVLTKDRMPPGGRRYVSAPISQAVGEVYGFAVGPTDPWDWGDIWSKCWLNTSQTVTALPTPQPSGGSISVSVSAGAELTASDSRQLVFLESSSDPGALVSLPGFIAMPVVTFDLPMDPYEVLVELKWEFHVQLEGENAGLWIGETPNALSCVINHPQWPIREI